MLKYLRTTLAKWVRAQGVSAGLVIKATSPGLVTKPANFF